ncbi:hypothetical protein X975_17197, partial [Stegodyphus mimosarum]
MAAHVAWLTKTTNANANHLTQESTVRKILVQQILVRTAAHVMLVVVVIHVPARNRTLDFYVKKVLAP